MAGKKRELEALKRRVAALEAEVATLKGHRSITWTLPSTPPDRGWQPPWICGDSTTRGQVKVIRSGDSQFVVGGKTFTWNATHAST